ncbi:unnamed protein product [Protopolystoma xenopodis]|uniref:Uncharacterized protein n=1 Tax=Protopolystoma xenopodis TaxID=117903 RepID=A0A3S5ABC0_9PLAT|nr:unnamed protein product [Protopolystoma xenopodis]
MLTRRAAGSLASLHDPSSPTRHPISGRPIGSSNGLSFLQSRTSSLSPRTAWPVHAIYASSGPDSQSAAVFAAASSDLSLSSYFPSPSSSCSSSSSASSAPTTGGVSLTSPSPPSTTTITTTTTTTISHNINFLDIGDSLVSPTTTSLQVVYLNGLNRESSDPTTAMATGCETATMHGTVCPRYQTAEACQEVQEPQAISTTPSLLQDIQR